MRIGLDIDNVIRDWVTSLIYNFRCDFPNENIEIKPTFDIAQWSTIGQRIYKYAFEEKPLEIYLSALPMPGAIEYLNELKLDSHRIVLISNQPNEKTRAFTNIWLGRYSIPFDELHYTSRKWEVKCDIFVDDYLKNIEDYRKHVEVPCIVFDAPWNANSSPRFYRAYGWKELYSIIKRINENNGGN